MTRVPPDSVRRTFRNLPYFAPGSGTRDAAEAVQKRRDNGDTNDAIAEDLNTSVATVRRMITDDPEQTP